MNVQKAQNLLYKQPILCPWISSQPYHSPQLNKNRNTSQTNLSTNKRFLTNPQINKEALLNSSRTQFFYFLRLMQLFPDIHPATIHTVLNLCKNDFASAVDKLLYAKRYKILSDKRNSTQKLIISRDGKCPTVSQNNNMETLLKEKDKIYHNARVCEKQNNIQQNDS